MEVPAVASIHITSKGGAPPVCVDMVRAIPGLGLEGDRYSLGTGTYSLPIRLPYQQLTLIEAEQIEWLNLELGICLLAGSTRRNIVTRGVSLNGLVGREFRIGPVLIRGHRLCDPCSHLERLTKSGVLSGLVNKGGLRAEILTEGIIHVGDLIKVVWLLNPKPPRTLS